MRSPCPILLLALGLATVPPPAVAPSAGAEPAPAAVPLAYLCDGPAAPASPPERGWTRLEEDDRGHRFAACPMLTNDKIVAVLKPGAAAIDLYWRQTQGLKLCARLQPVCGGSAEFERDSVAIRENSRASVAIQVEFRSPRNEPCHITYELAAGAAFLTTTAGPGVESLRVRAPCRFAVLPDFFGDDIVVDAAAIPVPRAELPSENFLLNMIQGGEAIVMTVSESRANDIAVALSGDARRESSPRTLPTGRSRTCGSPCSRIEESGTIAAWPWPTPGT